jgi:hypothetical protein
VVHDHFVVGGVLGGGAAQLLKRAPEVVALSALLRTPPAVIGQRAWAVLVRLATSLGLVAPSCLGQSGAWDEKSAGGDGANFIANGIALDLCRLVPTQTEWGVESVCRQ